MELDWRWLPAGWLRRSGRRCRAHTGRIGSTGAPRRPVRARSPGMAGAVAPASNRGRAPGLCKEKQLSNLQEPAPDLGLRYTRGFWHYCADWPTQPRCWDSGTCWRTTAPPRSTQRGFRRKPRRTQLHELTASARGAPPPSAMAARQNRSDDAVGALRSALAIEDELIDVQPTAWPLTLHRSLGSVLLTPGGRRKPARCGGRISGALRRTAGRRIRPAASLRARIDPGGRGAAVEAN